jgi:hypothetical protein
MVKELKERRSNNTRYLVGRLNIRGFSRGRGESLLLSHGAVSIVLPNSRVCCCLMEQFLLFYQTAVSVAVSWSSFYCSTKEQCLLMSQGAVSIVLPNSRVCCCLMEQFLLFYQTAVSVDVSWSSFYCSTKQPCLLLYHGAASSGLNTISVCSRYTEKCLVASTRSVCVPDTLRNV